MHGRFQGQGRGRGAGPGRGRGQVICYNCGEAVHFVRDYTNPTHASCQYCQQFDHVIEECLVLMENMQKKAQPQQLMQNIQMMRVEPYEKDQSINTVLTSGMTIGADKSKQPKEDGWVRKVAEKEVDFDLNQVKKTFMEAKKNFIEASTSGSHEKTPKTSVTQKIDPSILATFLQTCMKLLRDQKAVEGLQDLIDKCANKEKTPTEQRKVRKIGNHKM